MRCLRALWALPFLRFDFLLLAKVRSPYSLETVTPVRSLLTTGVPASAAIPISRYAGRRRFSRCGGLFIQAVTAACGVLSGPVPQTRFSPTVQLRAPVM